MRRKTINVSVGDVIIGSDYPIVTQSMTTVSTLDTESSVEEAIRIIDAGGQIVRSVSYTHLRAHETDS